MYLQKMWNKMAFKDCMKLETFKHSPQKSIVEYITEFERKAS